MIGEHSSDDRPTRWDGEARADLVLAILGGELTVAEACAEHGLRAEEVVGWRDLYLAAGKRHRRQVARIGERSRGVAMKVAAALVACVLILGGGAAIAASGACPNELPFCFQSGTPAKAVEINENLDQLLEWLEAKVGDKDEADVTMPAAASVGGALSVSGRLTVNVSGGGEAIRVSDDADIYGVDIIEGYNDLRLRGGSATSFDHLKIEENGNVTANGRWSRSNCPSGFTYRKTNLCSTGERTATTYLSAAADCLDEGAHLCTQAEYHYWGATSILQSDLGNWLGDAVADDQVLHINSATIANFEGPANKGDSRSYRCCMGWGR